MVARLIGASVVLLALLPGSGSGTGPQVGPDLDAPRRANAIVAVDNMTFAPGTVKVNLDDLVTWEFLDTMAHNTTSTQGFWSSGTRLDGTFAHEFTSSGSFAYLCTIHPSMRGVVKVRLQATGSPTAGWRIRWAVVPGDEEIDYDVQVRRAGSKKWKAFRTDVTSPTGRFNPARSGRYALRARTARNAASSGWSPVRRLRVS